MARHSPPTCAMIASAVTELTVYQAFQRFPPKRSASALRFVSYALAFQSSFGHSTGQPDRGCNRSLSISKNTLP